MITDGNIIYHYDGSFEHDITHMNGCRIVNEDYYVHQNKIISAHDHKVLYETDEDIVKIVRDIENLYLYYVTADNKAYCHNISIDVIVLLDYLAKPWFMYVRGRLHDHYAIHEKNIIRINGGKLAKYFIEDVKKVDTGRYLIKIDEHYCYEIRLPRDTKKIILEEIYEEFAIIRQDDKRYLLTLLFKGNKIEIDDDMFLYRPQQNQTKSARNV